MHASSKFFASAKEGGSLLPVKADTRDGPEHREHKRPGCKCLSLVWLLLQLARPIRSIRAEQVGSLGCKLGAPGAKRWSMKFRRSLRAGVSSPMLHLTGLSQWVLPAQDLRLTLDKWASDLLSSQHKSCCSAHLQLHYIRPRPGLQGFGQCKFPSCFPWFWYCPEPCSMWLSTLFWPQLQGLFSSAGRACAS